MVGIRTVDEQTDTETGRHCEVREGGRDFRALSLEQGVFCVWHQWFGSHTYQVPYVVGMIWNGKAKRGKRYSGHAKHWSLLVRPVSNGAYAWGITLMH